jgi:hypothetical protein
MTRSVVPWLRRWSAALALAGAPLRADVPAAPLLEWNELMLAAVRVDNSGPTLSSRNLAMLDAALYDAVNSLAGTHEPYLGRQPVPAGGASAEAAVAGAGFELLRALYPSFTPRAQELFDRQTAAGLSAAGTNGIELGRACALAMLKAREADGANTQVPYIPSAAPGQWRRTAPFFRPPLDPHWRLLQLFALPGRDEFVPSPPPALASAEYAAAFHEVKALGAAASADRTPEQSQIAVFWSDFSYTAMPPGHWHELTGDVVRRRQTPLAAAARLFALVSLAQADAAIVCWETKYRYNFWRPITAIRRAAEDGNDATAADAEWNHFLAAPPFPEYTSGHSTFSAAGATMLARFYGTEALEFTAKSDSLPGVTRGYTNVTECAAEIGRSRIYGGIHFEFSNAAGKACGVKIAEHIWQHRLRPVAGK